MMMALAGTKRLPACRAGRDDPQGRGGRRHGEGADAGGAVCAGGNHARLRGADGLPRLRIAGRRVSVYGHGGHVAGRGRGARVRRCRSALGSLGRGGVARHGATVGAGGDGDGDDGQTMAGILTDDAVHNAMVVRGGGRFDQSRVARAGNRARARGTAAADGGGLGVDQRAGAAAGGRVAQRADALRDGRCVPGGRRARGDAASAGARLLRLDALTVQGRRSARISLGGKSPSAARAFNRSCAISTASTRPRSVLAPDRARAAGLIEHGFLLRGDLAPEGALVKSAAIDPELARWRRGCLPRRTRRRVFGSEDAAITAAGQVEGRGCAASG